MVEIWLRWVDTDYSCYDEVAVDGMMLLSVADDGMMLLLVADDNMMLVAINGGR